MPKTIKVLKSSGWVFLSVVIFLVCVISRNARADVQPYIDTGFTFHYSDLRTGGVGTRFDDAWDAQIEIIGEGDTAQGYQEPAYTVSVSRVFKTHFMFLGGEFRPGIGIVASPGMQTVGPINYRLRLIWSDDDWEIEYSHDSNANIFSLNSGIDKITFRRFLT